LVAVLFLGESIDIDAETKRRFYRMYLLSMILFAIGAVLSLIIYILYSQIPALIVMFSSISCALMLGILASKKRE
jgi:hypothetical protein